VSLYIFIRILKQFFMVKLVVLTSVYYVFDEMPKRIKIYKNAK